MKKILRALAFMGSVFSVFMLALLRVFLDPKLYGPSSQSRLQQLANPNLMPIEIYNSDIPEAVPSENPAYPDAAPAYAPAAYAPEAYAPEAAPAAYELEVHVPSTYGGGGMSYDQQATSRQSYAPSPYGEPAPVEMEMPANAQVYADGSPGGDNPYVSTDAQPYGAVSQPSGYAGPEGNIPVLGTTDPKPYS